MTAAAEAVPPRGVVIVLSWHGKDDTLACVASLRAGSADTDVLVIDNGSFDGVLDAVARQWPAVHVLQTGDNLGFAGGMNAGLRWALTRDYSRITVLNNDTTVPPGAIAELEVICGEGRAVSPEVFYADDPGRVWFGAGAIDARTMLPHHVPAALLSEAAALRPSEVLAGCCITASAAVWRAVGLFDERFFLNFEDSEWSVRARARGVELFVCTRVGILHRVSASIYKAPGAIGYYYYPRNGLLFTRLMKTGPATRWRFLRGHVLPAVAGNYSRGGVRVGLAVTCVFLAALRDYAFGRFGRAPRWVERS